MRVIAIAMFVLLFSFAAPSAGASETDAVKVLASATVLRCVFKTAIETTWESGGFQTRPQKGFSFSLEDINSARGNAKAVARGGAAHLEMIALSNVRHFLGFTANGDLNSTSVHGQFAGGGADSGLLASHSVHMASEPPKTFQHYGVCIAK